MSIDNSIEVPQMSTHTVLAPLKDQTATGDVSPYNIVGREGAMISQDESVEPGSLRQLNDIIGDTSPSKGHTL